MTVVNLNRVREKENDVWHSYSLCFVLIVVFALLFWLVDMLPRAMPGSSSWPR